MAQRRTADSELDKKISDLKVARALLKGLPPWAQILAGHRGCQRRVR